MKTNVISFFANVFVFTLLVSLMGCEAKLDDAPVAVTEAESSASAVTATDQPSKAFRPEDIEEIKKLLKDLDSTNYRVVLPQMNGSRQNIGTQSYGTFPITEVRRIASLRNIHYTDSGNLQAIFQNCNGGGAGSHTESRSGATGREIISKIEDITRNVDNRAYMLIK